MSRRIITQRNHLPYISRSRQRGDGGAGQPGWDPKTSDSLPQRRPLAPVPLLPGERPSSPRPAGPSALVPEGKGQHGRSFFGVTPHKWHIIGILLGNKMLNQPYLINKSIKMTFGHWNGGCIYWLEWCWWMHGLMFSLRHHTRSVYLNEWMFLLDCE